MVKTLVKVPILANSAQIPAADFFFKTLASSVSRYHDQLSSCTISEKTDDTILRKGRKNGRTDDRRTDRWTRVISQYAVRLTSSIQ